MTANPITTACSNESTIANRRTRAADGPSVDCERMERASVVICAAHIAVIGWIFVPATHSHWLAAERPIASVWKAANGCSIARGLHPSAVGQAFLPVTGRCTHRPVSSAAYNRLAKSSVERRTAPDRGRLRPGLCHRQAGPGPHRSGGEDRLTGPIRPGSRRSPGVSAALALIFKDFFCRGHQKKLPVSNMPYSRSLIC